MNNPNPITEADMLAYLRDVTAYYAPKFPELRDFNAGSAYSNAGVALMGYTDAAYTAAVGIGPTFPSAADELRKKLGTPADNAAKLREQAAKLIAEADKLESTKSP